MKNLGIFLGIITSVVAIVLFAVFLINIAVGDTVAIQNSGLLLLATAPPAIYIIWSLNNLKR